MAQYGLRVKGRKPFDNVRMAYKVIALPETGSGEFTCPEPEGARDTADGKGADFVYTCTPIRARQLRKFDRSGTVMMRKTQLQTSYDLSFDKPHLTRISWNCERVPMTPSPVLQGDLEDIVVGIVIWKESAKPREHD